MIVFDRRCARWSAAFDGPIGRWREEFRDSNAENVRELGHGVEREILQASFDASDVVGADRREFCELLLGIATDAADLSDSAAEVLPDVLRAGPRHRRTLAPEGSSFNEPIGDSYRAQF